MSDCPNDKTSEEPPQGRDAWLNRTATRRVYMGLGEAERERVRALLNKPSEAPGMPFSRVTRAYERVLYALWAADEPLSEEEAYLLLVGRWSVATDLSSVRRRLALAVQQGEVRWLASGRYHLTVRGVDHLKRIEEDYLAPPRPQPRAPRPAVSRPSRPISRNRRTQRTGRGGYARGSKGAS